MNQAKQKAIANELYQFMRDYASMKIEEEDKREQSLLHQSSNMQAAFSFTSAALFMVAAIVTDHRGSLPLEYFLVVFSIITALLLISLFFTCLAQKREKFVSIPDIELFNQTIEDNFESYLSETQRNKAIVDLLEKVQKDKKEKNDYRALCVIRSMRFFYSALGCSIVSYLIGIIMLIAD